MGVCTVDLLKFIKDLLNRENSTLLDGGVILNDDVRERGIRLLHAAGWQTQAEYDDSLTKEKTAEEIEEDEIQKIAANNPLAIHWRFDP